MPLQQGTHRRLSNMEKGQGTREMPAAPGTDTPTPDTSETAAGFFYKSS
ncbi:MAG: hypothetical protein KME26_19725 [Oscillatoria princeps RMCB-10]|nr:hypothetical protein [Oscillatoria princeps RMCB-10]